MYKFIFLVIVLFAAISSTLFAQNYIQKELSALSYPELPVQISEYLVNQNYQIPQCYCEPSPHNVIRGAFITVKSQDWAILVSKNDSSSILKFQKRRIQVICKVLKIIHMDFLDILHQLIQLELRRRHLFMMARTLLH